MNIALQAHELANSGDWVGIPTRLPGLDARAGQWRHLTATDPTTASRAVALLAGKLRPTAGTLRIAVDRQAWEPTNGSAHLWAWLRREIVHYAGGYLPIAPSEPVGEAVTRLTGSNQPEELLSRHGLARLAERRWGELAARPRHQISLVVALASPLPILILDLVGLQTPALIDHAAERVDGGALIVSAGDHPVTHQHARTVHLPDEGNQ
ncbi:hypothetical protein [Enemella sp. A6]|uniref:hypothetical protein n=1 Tax=Enemella sp. A6 TaxID=3440152 RepID=UPI003EBABC4F